MKKTVLGIMMAILALSACEQGSDSARDPNTLYTLMSANPNTLNVVSAVDAYANVIHQRISDPLLEMDKDLNIMPCVAKSWKWVKQDGLLILEFKLRDDVYWHDGIKMTAQDWVYTFSVITNVNSKAFNKSVKFKEGTNWVVDWVKAPDDYTLQVAYNRPFAPALMSWVDMFALPRHIYEKLNWEEFHASPYNRSPLGNGAFMFKKWTTGKQIELVANTNYWRTAPLMKRILYKIINDDNVALIAFRNGDFDIFAFTPEQYLLEAKKDYFSNDYTVVTYSTFSTGQLAWNCASNSIFSDRLVRRAMTHALDRVTIAREILHGFSTIITGPNYINSWAYDKSIKPWPFDLEKSASLLKQAGWSDTDKDGILDKDGRPLKFEVLMGSGSPDQETMMLNLRQNLQKIGVDMEIRPLEWGALSTRLRNKEFDAIMFGWSLDYDPDLYDIFHSDSIKDGLNYGSYSNPKIDALISLDRHTLDKNQRIKYQFQMHQILHEDQVYTHLFSRKAIVAIRKNLKGWGIGKDGLFNYYPGLDAIYRDIPATNK